jgi:RES domain-containing protein
LNGESRFGAAFYATDDPETALAEVASHGAPAANGIRFTFNSGAANIIDLTDSEVAASYGYERGPITEATQTIGDKATEAGYDAIRFASERGAGTNYAILGNFNTLLSPQMITPLP